MSNFTPQECEQIITVSKEYEKRHASATLQLKGEILKVLHEFYNIKIPRTQETQWIFDRFKEHMLNKFPSNNIDMMVDVTCNIFPEGCNLDKHIDSERQEGVIRICGVILNNDYLGGEFILYDPVEELTSEIGEIYDIDVTNRVHEIKKVTSGERVSLVLFLTKEDLNIKPILF